jgi:predicted ester cyclase
MATPDNASILRAMYDAFNAKDIDRIMSHAEASARMRNVPFDVEVGLREYCENWVRAFPDARIEITALLAQDDQVVAEFTGKGTHDGPLSGPGGVIGATGRRVELPVVEIYRMREGKVAGGRCYFDAGSFMAQLGIGARLAARQGGERGRLTVKKFSSPDETRSFGKGRAEILELSEGTIGRGIFEKGWRWSKDVKPIAGTASCEIHHSGYVLSGRMHIVMDDGQEADLEPGDLVSLPPGHDAWTVGNDACVIVDFAGMERYARRAPGAEAGQRPPVH